MSATRTALHIAKFLGAGRVVGAGRDLSRLEGSPADELVSLLRDAREVGSALANAASESDIVLDYLWGEPAGNALLALLSARRERSKRITWVEIGSVAGADITLPSAAFRATNLCLMGSGQGSVPVQDIVSELPRIAEVLASGSIPVNVQRVPLSNVEAAWNAPRSAGQRVVFVP